jgi:hypothetical protein
VRDRCAQEGRFARAFFAGATAMLSWAIASALRRATDAICGRRLDLDRYIVRCGAVWSNSCNCLA